MKLAGTTRPFNMVTFYWAALTGILLQTFVPQMQPYLLTEFLEIPEGEQGVVSGNLSFWGELVIIAMVGVWGTLSDRIGRRPVTALGFLIMSAGVFAYPQARTYEALLLVRLAFAAGAAAYSVMLVTLVADYVSDDSRGRATGLMGFCNGVGALITVMLILRLPKMFQDAGQTPIEAGFTTYWIIGGLTLFTGILMWLGLQDREVRQEERQQPLLAQIREGL